MKIHVMKSAEPARCYSGRYHRFDGIFNFDKMGTRLWPIRRNAVTTQAQEHLESSDFNHRLLAIGPTRNFSNF